MQGTAAVVLSALMSAVGVTKSALKDQRIVVFGFGEYFDPSPMLPLTTCAGTAGLGIADGIRSALMISEGLTSEEARKCFWFVPRFPSLRSLLTP